MNKVRERTRRLRARVAGFSLIEVVIAIAVIAVTFIGLIGLLGLGVANDQTSSEQTVANNIAASIQADLRSTPAYTTSTSGPIISPRFGITFPTAVVSSSSTPLTTGSGAKLFYLYFDNSPNVTPYALPYVPYTSAQSASTVPGAVYAANVYLAEISSFGPKLTASTGTILPQTQYMARIVVSWPTLTTATLRAASMSSPQFLIH